MNYVWRERGRRARAAHYGSTAAGGNLARSFLRLTAPLGALVVLLRRDMGERLMLISQAVIEDRR